MPCLLLSICSYFFDFLDIFCVKLLLLNCQAQTLNPKNQNQRAIKKQIQREEGLNAGLPCR